MESNQPTQCIKCNKTKKTNKNGICPKCYKLEHFKLVICINCGEEKPHASRQMCEPCYKSWHKEQNREKYQELGKVYREAHKQKQNDYNKVYYQANQEKIKENVKFYRQNNLEKLIQYDRDRHNTDTYKAKAKKYALENILRFRERDGKRRRERPDLHRKYKHIRRARIYNLPRTLTEQEWQNILEKFNYSCAYCGIKPTIIHREHKIPLSKGGGYTAENIVPSCATCNLRKQRKTDVEFREYLQKYPRVSDKQSVHT